MYFTNYCLLIGVLLTTSLSSIFIVPASAQGNFTVTGSPSGRDNCGTTLICLNGPHIYGGMANGTYAGRLTLISDEPALKQQSAGLLLYGIPVRMLDLSTRQAASFNTSYTTDIVMENWNPNEQNATMLGDGWTFVITADSTTVGTPAKCLGIYDGNGQRSSKTIVVEFDTYQNLPAPVFDISGNHVSFDFMNITTTEARNASEVNIQLWEQVTLYTWIEYSAETQQLEVRISRDNSRPTSPFLGHQVDMFAIAEEYMYVGFSSGNGDDYSSYYIANWTFESYGIQPATRGKGRNLGVIVGVLVGVLLVVLVCVVALFLSVRKWKRVKHLELGSESFKEDPMVQLQLSGMPERFSYKQLSVATTAFSEESKLGQGGFGSVYRGVLPSSGEPVAVKRISADSKQGEREFLAEVSIISQLRHRNLIQLVGWCKERCKYLLVYELMPHGSLDKALFRADDESSALSWQQRFNIITGTAAAVDYLHQGWKQQVIHRDIKVSNIMLDDEWNAKLGDFGLARLVDHHGPSATTMVAGTYGYIAPEAAVSGKFTDKTDVFAFGAVALEVACGRKAFLATAPPEERVLVDWVWQCLSQGKLLSVVDKRLTDYDVYWVEVLLLLGLLCSHPNPTARPAIRHVVQVLAGDAPVPPVPASKPETVYTGDSKFVRIQDLQWVHDLNSKEIETLSSDHSNSAVFASSKGSTSSTSSFELSKGSRTSSKPRSGAR